MFNCIPLFSGVFAEYLLKVPLTVVDEFHSHLEPLNQIPTQTIRKQVLFIHSFIDWPVDNRPLQWTLIIFCDEKFTKILRFVFNRFPTVTRSKTICGMSSKLTDSVNKWIRRGFFQYIVICFRIWSPARLCPFWNEVATRGRCERLCAKRVNQINLNDVTGNLIEFVESIYQKKWN